MGLNRERRLVITDIDGTLNNYDKRRAACLKAVRGTEYKGDIRKLDIEALLSPEQHQIYLRLFFSEEGAFTRLDSALPDAPQILTYFHIGRGLRIVYLTGRLSGSHGAGLEDTINWLEENRFPVPNNREVYLFTRNDPRKSDLESKRDDMKIILELGNPVAGIGDKPYDATVYRGFGIPAISFLHPRWEEPEKKAEYPPETIFVGDWGEIKLRIEELL